jgi:hypothetical protein
VFIYAKYCIIRLMGQGNIGKSKDYYGHTHEDMSVENYDSKEDAGAVVIPFLIQDETQNEPETLKQKNRWHTPVAFGLFGGMLGGIMALPTIEMIESEHGFNTEVPGNIGVGALVVGGGLFVATAVYKHFKP